jgi:hypothetical protein
MYLTPNNFLYLGECIEALLFGEISVLPTVAPPFLKNQQSGLYSGIFVLYWLYHRASKKGADFRQNIIFYSLCVLYVLSGVVFGTDIATFVAGTFVSNIEHLSNFKLISCAGA